MFTHQNDGNPFGQFSKDAIAGIDMVPDACVCERSLAEYSLRALLARVIGDEGTYVADSLRHVQSRWDGARARRSALVLPPTPNPMSGFPFGLPSPLSARLVFS